MTGNDCCENTAVTCECKAEEIILLPCSGGSNCGQITNDVAVKLDDEGVGRIYCLAGIGAHVDGMVGTAGGCQKNSGSGRLPGCLCKENHRACWIESDRLDLCDRRGC